MGENILIIPEQFHMQYNLHCIYKEFSVDLTFCLPLNINSFTEDNFVMINISPWIQQTTRWYKLVSILLWSLWCCLIGHVLSSNIPLYPGGRTTGACSTCKCLCHSFYNIYNIVVTSWCEYHCCHWYCNINNNNYTTVSRQNDWSL